MNNTLKIILIVVAIIFILWIVGGAIVSFVAVKFVKDTTNDVIDYVKDTTNEIVDYTTENGQNIIDTTTDMMEDINEKFENSTQTNTTINKEELEKVEEMQQNIIENFHQKQEIVNNTEDIEDMQEMQNQVMQNYKDMQNQINSLMAQ